MEKEFIPYKEALALKELGFDVPCFTGFYMEDSIYTTPSNMKDFNKKGENFTSRPFYQQAFRWFREECPHIDFCLPIKKIKDLGCFWGGYINGESYGSNYLTYEEAELACLKKLIEIVKNG